MTSININETTTIDMLSVNSVSILKQQMAEINGETVQVGEAWRRAFVNSVAGRTEIKEALDEPYLSSVMAVWGDAPTVEDMPAAELPTK